jgi:hypothetical protein
MLRAARRSSSLPKPIDQKRAERIARSHACDRCLEYSFKKLSVRPSTAAQRKELGAAWLVVRVCGVCGNEQELALDAEGDIVYIS